MKKIFYVCQQKIKAHFKYLILQLLLILFFIFLCYVFSLPPAPPPPPAPTSPRPSVEVDSSLLEKEKADSVFNQFRACSDQAFADTESDEGFISRYRQCIDSKIPSFQFDRFAMGRMDEYKVFLPMKESFDPKSCRWMTIGVGGTDNAEKEFKAKYSQCKVFGVEPSPSQYANFEDYGTIIPYGVGATNGTAELYVRDPTGHNKKQVYVLAMSEILDKFVGSRLIHYVTIDIEGFEYGILKELLAGKILAEQGIVFCQIDAELHGPDKKPAAQLMHDFDTSASDYVPVYSQVFAYHEKVTWINVKNEECRNAFDIQSLLE